MRNTSRISSALCRGRRRSLALCLLYLLVAPWAAAQVSPSPVRFDQAVARAVALAPSVGARQAGARAAQEEAARASALPDPMLSLGIDNLPVTGAHALDFGVEDMTMKRVGIAQEFPARAKRRAQQQVADRRIDEARTLTLAEQLAVRRATAQAWIELWAAEQEATELRRLREQSALAVRVAKARFAGGGETAAEAMATQASALELDNRIAGAEAALEAARGGLARWLDVSPEQLATAGAPPDLRALPVGEGELLASVGRQAALLPWASREAVAEAEVALAAAQKRPDWTLAASYGQRSGDRSDMLSLEVSVPLPLFAVSRQDHGIAARRADLAAVVASREDARRAQVEAIRRVLAEWRGLSRQVERKEKEILPLASDRARIALAAYRGGGPLQPWLDARGDEIELHVEHAGHLRDLGRAWTALAYLLPTEETQP
jgi:outer membrane protein TolC